MSRTFCSSFDSRFLARALVMWDSIRASDPGSHLHAICFDEATLTALQRLQPEALTPWPLAALEEWDPELRAVRPSRSWVEYMWTATPDVALFALEMSGAAEVTYLDADLMFFSTVEPLFEEMGDAPLLLTPHRHPAAYASLLRFGLYNVQFLPLRDTPESLKAFRWWRERCLEHCSTQLRGDRYGDQKYLERWPDLFEGVHVLRHPGGGLAPWNMEAHAVEEAVDGSILVDGLPLVFFHFTHFRRWQGGGIQLADPRFRIGPAARELIFEPYRQRLEERSTQAARLGLGIEPWDAPRRPRDRLNQLHSRTAGVLNRTRAALSRG